MTEKEIQDRINVVKNLAAEYQGYQEQNKSYKSLAGEYKWNDLDLPPRKKLSFTTINGIDFYMVGHNSSHEFYLGLDEAGNYWARSFGEDAYYDENDVDSEPTYSEHIYKVDNLEDVYLGHL